MTETQERFLRAIVARVPLADVVEVHLFPPIRRGTLETGVAVLAVAPPPVLTVVAAGDNGGPPTDEVPDAEAEVAAEVDASVDVGVDVQVDATVEVPLAPGVDVAVEVGVDASEEASEGPVDAAEPDPARRLRILTASYRATIKGPDRGKWVVEVQEEADAPLSAVEAVLRGVRQRSAEPADPELVSVAVLHALVTTAAVAPAA